VTSQLGAVQLALVTFVLFTLAASGVTSLLARRLVGSVARVPPAVAAGRLRWLLAMPVGVGASMTLIAFLPSVAASLADVHHHCASHAGHPHLCVVHLPAGAGSATGWLVVAVAVAVVALRVLPVIAEVRRSSRLVAALLLPATRRGTVTVPSSEPLCATVGMWAPTVVVSSGFAEAVGPEALTAAVAHERAHARRRDTLWRVATSFAAVALPHAVAARLQAALDLATERACDEDAAVELGDRLLVADAILRAQRLGLRRWSGVAAGFGPGHCAARVDALLAPLAGAPTGVRRWDVIAALVAIAAVAAAGPVHHAAETALSLVAH
jgi:Zn-dependent protease with chaperone function